MFIYYTPVLLVITNEKCIEICNACWAQTDSSCMLISYELMRLKSKKEINYNCTISLGLRNLSLDNIMVGGLCYVIWTYVFLTSHKFLLLNCLG